MSPILFMTVKWHIERGFYSIFLKVEHLFIRNEKLRKKIHRSIFYLILLLKIMYIKAMQWKLKQINLVIELGTIH